MCNASRRSLVQASWCIPLTAVLLLVANLATAQDKYPRAVDRRPMELEGADYQHRPNLQCMQLILRSKQLWESQAAQLRRNPRAMVTREIPDSLMQSVRSCAYRDDSVRRETAFNVMREELLREGRLHMGIPEYHDEQRLATDAVTSQGLTKLGPVAGIFASATLGDFRYRWQIAAHGRMGIVAAYVVVLQEPNDTLPDSYKRLNLKFGMNCLMLAEGPSGYRAWVVQPTKDQPCRDDHGVVGSPTGSELKVMAMRTGFAQHDMVAAGRFLDDTRGRPIFGLPCLDAWCEIGPSDFTPRTETYCDWFVSSAPAVPCEANPEARIASWYDEQNLEEYGDDGWVASPVRAAIVPQPSITRFSDNAFNDTLRHLSNLYIKDTLDHTSRMYYHGVRQGENRVELVYTTATRTWKYVITPITHPLPAGVRPIPFGVVAVHEHYDAPIPGTARFRYTIRDPGLWGPCGHKCCDSDGGW